MKIYDLDHAATTPINEGVISEMLHVIKHDYGNPSSMHAIGIHNRKAINTARKEVAELLRCKPSELIFTSSGTESINLALKGICFTKSDRTEIITTNIEHKATIETLKYLGNTGYTVHDIPVDKEGFVDLDKLEAKLSKRTLLVTIIWANNEIGTIQRVEKIVSLARKYGAYIHLDAVQVIGHYPIDLSILDVDLLSISAHKFYGPKGSGLLFVRDGIRLTPQIHGGNQEFGLRSGTENVSGIIGLAEALKHCYRINHHRQDELTQVVNYFRLSLEQNFKVTCNGPAKKADQLPGLMSISFADEDATRLAYQFNQKGIFVSTGSACQSNTQTHSHVIEAIGNDPRSTIRISIGYDLTREDIDEIIRRMKEILG